MADLYIFPDKKEASLFVCQALILLWPEIKLFGFATGGSPVLVYGLLIQACQDEKISFKDIYIINLDEYVGLAPDHAQSYAKYLKDIYCQLDIDMQKNVFPSCLINCHSEIQKTCLRMEKWIKKHGPVTVWILGIGENAHFAFVEPRLLEFDTKSEDFLSAGCQRRHYHVEELSDSTREANKRFFGNDINAVPMKAVSAGYCSVFEGKHLYQLAFGAKKASAVVNAFLGSMTSLVPSSYLQRHPDWKLVADEQAGAEILKYLSEKKIKPKQGSDGKRFYEATSEAGIAHRIYISRTLVPKYSIPTRILEEEEDLR